MGIITRDSLLSLETYHKERPVFREKAIKERRLRTVHLGDHVTLIFENEFLMRYQIQEMLRVERVVSDEGVLEEIKAYNPMIPEVGQLCATLFIELTNDEQMREWLTKLVGIERAIAIKMANGEVVKAVVDEGHAEQLTRETVTAAVHYIRFEFTPQQVQEFAKGNVQVISTLSNYLEAVELADFTVAELLTDLQ